MLTGSRTIAAQPIKSTKQHKRIKLLSGNESIFTDRYFLYNQNRTASPPKKSSEDTEEDIAIEKKNRRSNAAKKI